MASEPYGHFCLGRPIAEFKPPFIETDKTFCGQRQDNREVDSADLQHCTFISLGFKATPFKNSKFLNCIFVNCYFRRSIFSNCTFTGCWFIDCNFDHVALKGCHFKYSRFRSCQIAYSEIEFSLPREPNLREELCRNLAIESRRLGLSQQGRVFRIAEIKAHEEHLKAAVLRSSQWYEDHFRGMRRFAALLKLTGSLLNRWLWGYGHQSFRLAISAITFPIVIFPAISNLYIDELMHRSDKEIALTDLVHFSLENFIPAGISSNLVPISVCTQLWSGFESLTGVIFATLFATHIFRWSLQR